MTASMAPGVSSIWIIATIKVNIKMMNRVRGKLNSLMCGVQSFACNPPHLQPMYAYSHTPPPPPFLPLFLSSSRCYSWTPGVDRQYVMLDGAIGQECESLCDVMHHSKRSIKSEDRNGLSKTITANIYISTF